MPVCCVPGCASSFRQKHKGLSFHQFPKKRREEWITALKLTTQKVSERSVVCSKHFRDADIIRTKGRIRLVNSAIPFISLLDRDGEIFVNPSTSSQRRQSPRNHVQRDLFQVGHTTSPGVTNSSSFSSIKSTTSSNSDVQEKHLLLPIFEAPELTVKPSSSDSEQKRSSSPIRDPLELHSYSYRLAEKTPTKKKVKSKFTSPSDAESATHSAKKRKCQVLGEHRYSYPSHYDAKHLKLRKDKIGALQKNLISAKRKTRRLKRRVTQLKEIVDTLKNSSDLTLTALDHIEQSFSGIPLALIERLLLKKHTKYPEELRSFAMTLQFYSTKAYEYVRETFDLSLPSQSTIRSWYSSVECEPGYNQNLFDSLKNIVEEAKAKGKEVICSLMLDEMSIKKQIDFDGEKARGYIDVGSNIVNDEASAATQVLVIMLVAVNDSWKKPISYFFINKLSAMETANIIKEAITRVSQVGVRIVSLTCDGPSVHIAMMKELGCDFTEINNLQIFFPNPINNDPVYVIFDICYMLKLVRNHWASMKILKDSDNNEINWQYIEDLHKIQTEEGLVLANKLKRAHMEWFKQKMKVKLAAQTLSSSIADALEFLAYKLKMPQFQGIEATVKFIRVFDMQFDLLNSKNPYGRGCKTALKPVNKLFWHAAMKENFQYISTLTNISNVPLIKTQQKTPFIGFCVSTMSILKIYDDIVENGPLSYLLTYKFSQDHLEIFFSNIRARNGWNPNPTAFQFVHTFKRLMLHHDIKNMRGSCTSQDNTNILCVSSNQKVKKISANITDVTLCRKYGLSVFENDIPDEDAVILLNDNSTILSEYSKNIVTYISGYVIRTIMDRVHCFECLEAISPTNETKDYFNLIESKQRGGLVVPPVCVAEICLAVEKNLKRVLYITDGCMPPEKDFKDNFVHSVSRELILNKNIFLSLNNHVYDIGMFEDNHRSNLIKLIVARYMKVRLHSICKKQSEKIRGEYVRQALNKLILFRNQ